MILTDQRRWALAAQGMTLPNGTPYSEKGPMFPIMRNGEVFARPLSSTNSSTWQTYEDVMAWQERLGGYAGIFVSDGIVAVDIDTQKADDATKAIIDTIVQGCYGYIEKSPSGVGYRIILNGTIPRSRKTKAIELYSHSRFVRMTGEAIRYTPDAENEQLWLNFIYSQLEAIQGEDIEKLDLDLKTDIDVRKRYEEHILPNLPLNERANIEAIDRGDFDDGSMAGLIAATALFRVEEDPAVVFNIMLAIEGLQNHYANKHQEWENELARKFKINWAPSAIAKAKEANATKKANVALGKSIVEKLLRGEENKISEKQAQSAAYAKSKLEPQTRDTATFPEFPSALARLYRDWLTGTVLESEAQLINAATLSHLSALTARRFAAYSGTLGNLYLIVLAHQGAGKEVLSAGWHKLTKAQPHFNIPLPRSDIALHKAMLVAPGGLMILKEFGDRLREWTKQGSPTRHLPSILKDVYGVNAGGSFIGVAYSDADKNVGDILNPAVSILGEGTRDQVLNALSAYGTEDGFIGRMLFIEGGKDWIENDHPDMSPPPEIFASLQQICTGAIGMPQQPIQCGVTPEALQAFSALRKEERRQKRMDDNPFMAFWRAATQNAIKLANLMAVLDAVEAGTAIPGPNADTFDEGNVYTSGKAPGPVIALHHAQWGIDVVRYSIAQATAHMEVDSAYTNEDMMCGHEILRKMRVFFNTEWSDKSPQQRNMKEKGEFSLGYLGRLGAKIQDHSKGFNHAVDLGLKILVERDYIELVDPKRPNKRHYRVTRSLDDPLV